MWPLLVSKYCILVPAYDWKQRPEKGPRQHSARLVSRPFVVNGWVRFDQWQSAWLHSVTVSAQDNDKGCGHKGPGGEDATLSSLPTWANCARQPEWCPLTASSCTGMRRPPGNRRKRLIWTLPATSIPSPPPDHRAGGGGGAVAARKAHRRVEAPVGAEAPPHHRHRRHCRCREDCHPTEAWEREVG